MNLSDYLKILIKWKKFLIINFIFVLVVSFLVAFLTPKWYKSTASIKPTSGGDVSFFSSLLSSKGLSSVGKSFGVGGLQYSDLDYFSFLLQSRSITMRMIEEFDLKDRYGKEYYFETIKELLANTSASPDPTSNTLQLSVWDQDPEIAQKMVAYYLNNLSSLLDSLKNKEVEISSEAIEKRFEKNKLDLEVAEENLKNFQEKYNVVLPEDQFLNTIKVISELEAQKLFLETQLNVIKENQGVNSPTLNQILTQIRSLDKKIRDINTRQDSNSLYVSFNDAPKLINEYLRLYREIEIQSALLEIIYPMVEETRFNNASQKINFLVIDQPNVPEYKDKPKRAVIVLTGIILGSMLLIIFVFLAESYKKLKRQF